MSAPVGRGRGAILRPTEAERRIAVVRHSPDEALAPFVDYFWIVRWSTVAPYEQQVIPQPVVHLAAEHTDGGPRLLVHGVARTPFSRLLHGDGHVVAVAFRPGAFGALLRAPVGGLSDRVVPAGDVLGADDRLVAEALLRPGMDDDALVGGLGDWLRALRPDPDDVPTGLAELVALAERDRSITRAEQLAERAGVGLRTLQRQFSEHVGIGPKWVVRRFRILDAAAAAHAGEPADWAALADELGYSDQAHLVRAFTAVVGAPPATYARQASPPRDLATQPPPRSTSVVVQPPNLGEE